MKKASALFKSASILAATALVLITAPASAQAVSSIYFPETGHNVSGEFLARFQSVNSPLVLFGYPITEQIVSRDGLTVQYFQRARFEMHPEFPMGQRVTSTNIGRSLYVPALPLNIPPAEGCQSFSTGYAVCYSFLQFFNGNGGIPQFGNPISPFEFHDNTLVQYFEKARFEWKPSMPEGQQVSLTDLGRAYFDLAGEDVNLLTPVPPSAGGGVIAPTQTPGSAFNQVFSYLQTAFPYFSTSTPQASPTFVASQTSTALIPPTDMPLPVDTQPAEVSTVIILSPAFPSEIMVTPFIYNTATLGLAPTTFVPNTPTLESFPTAFPGDVSATASTIPDAIQEPTPTSSADDVTLTASPTPTLTPFATSTGTPTITFTPTLTFTSTPSPTPTYAILRGTVLQLSNCRYGPGQPYLYKYGLLKGNYLAIIGRIESGNWIYVRAIRGNNPCWVKTSLLNVEGDVMSVEVVYPGKAKLPVSPYYPPLTGAKATRSGDEVRLTWTAMALRAGDEESPTSPLYLVETWTCQGGQIVFTPIGAYDNVAYIKDEAGCSTPSHGRVFFSEKHGYAGPTDFVWPAK